MNTLKKLFTLLIAFVIVFSANAQVLDEPFDTYIPAGWTEFDGVLAAPVVPSGTSSMWVGDDFGNMGTSEAAKINLYSTTHEDWLITPSMDLGVSGTYQLEFDLAITEYGNLNPSTMGSDDIFAVVISTDDGATWTSVNTLQLWNSTTPISNSGDHIIISLAAYTGVVKIGFYAGDGPIDDPEDNDLFVDNVVVRETPTGPIFAVNPESHNYGTYILYDPFISQDFVVSNTGIGTLTIASADNVVLSGTNADMYTLTTSETYPINLGTAETATFTVEYTPSEGGTHTASLDITDNITKAVHNIPLTGECIDITLTPPFTENFEPTYPGDYWTEFIGILAEPTVTSSTFSNWTDDGFGNDGTDGSAKINIYGTSKKEWFATPPINLGAKADYQLEFDLALTEYNNTNASTLGDDDIFAVVISTDDGATWSSANVLQQWGSTDVISATGDHITIPLTGYTGIVKIGFYGESTVTNADNDLFVDNVSVFEVLLSTETDITAFSFAEQTGAATIDATAHTVEIEVANGTALTALTPTIEVSAGATVNPLSGVEQDFSSDVTYTVTAEDATTTQDWVVTVTEQPMASVTFIVDNATNNNPAYTGFALKGSWDVNGNYDATWNGGAEHTDFYDDGTHGDVTASDNIWTVTIDLIPDGGTNNWEWGVNNQDEIWIDGNFQFSVIDTSPFTLNFEIPVGIEDLASNGISIYPNPSNGVFNVSVTETFNLEVIDITGKVVKTQVLDNNTNTVNIAKQGVYILKLSNNNTSVTHRIIVN
ncbi:MAG: T9SS type A sorting domain-containing protein [Bacteroidales bacterium]|nr:T9SS type A sorting domain-containing protein [Bacteroidales bacterium]